MLQRDRVTGLPLIPANANELAGLSGIDWNDILKTSISTGAEIAKSRFGGPQPGQYFQDGQKVSYSLAPGSNPLTTFPGQTF